jgi:mycothiol system anti-sigma-R factor
MSLQEADCSQVLMRVYEYLDGEMTSEDGARIRAHLEDCGPCMTEFERDQALKALVRRSCGCEPAPAQLRLQIMATITRVSVTTTYIPVD